MEQALGKLELYESVVEARRSTKLADNVKEPGQCPLSNCTQAEGHSGPHGFLAAPGLVLGPHGGDEGKELPAEQTDLPCDPDSCSDKMALDKAAREK